LLSAHDALSAKAQMILEVAILNIRPGEGADFERAFAEAQAISAAMAGYAPVRARHSRCDPG